MWPRIKRLFTIKTRFEAFMVIYATVFSAGAVYILRLMARGPASGEPPPEAEPETAGRAPGSPLAAAPAEPKEG